MNNFEIKLKNSKPFLLCSVYRQLSSTAEWTDIFSQQIEKGILSLNEIYIMGDINVDLKNNQHTNKKWKQTVETRFATTH